MAVTDILEGSSPILHGQIVILPIIIDIADKRNNKAEGGELVFQPGIGLPLCSLVSVGSSHKALQKKRHCDIRKVRRLS